MDSLHLLAHGARVDAPEIDPELLRALRSFRYPLTVKLLRDVVERNNTRDMNLAQAEAALYSLYALGMKEARDYLWEIVTRRKRVIAHAYRRALRTTVEQLYEGI